MCNHQSIEWDEELISRYNVSGPRYTSYPTALEFNHSVNEQTYIRALRNLKESIPLSLYIHIPFCWHVCYYCACNKVITRDYSRVEPYLSALEKEMSLISQQLRNQRVTQIHWGGGTPTFLNADDRRRLIDLLRHYFSMDEAEGVELSIEVDPRTVTPDDIVALRQLGFNRLSLGIQDFEPKVQQAVHREQSFADVKKLMDTVRQQEFDSISFDLIYGLPFQSVASFKQTLEDVIELKPDRLSVFNYAHLPHRFKPQRRINESDLPSGEEKLRIFQLTIEMMQQAGYVYIGMDHFALPDDELAIAQKKGELHRNFQGYTTRKECDLIGLGVSAISSLDNNYVQNHRTLNEYLGCLSENRLPAWRGVQLDRDDLIRKTLIFEIICNFELDISRFSKQFNIEFWDYFSCSRSSLQRLADDGLIDLSKDWLQVTGKGRLLVRNVCMAFDRYLSQKSDKMIYSKAI